jgi:hypothetical protein
MAQSTGADARHAHDADPLSGYAPEGERPPLASYAVIAGGFSCGLATFLVMRRRSSAGLPVQIAAQDVALVGGASFALSRLLAKKKVTAFIRAPFTTYQGPADAPAELDERPRGEGAKRAVGELLTCPHCLNMWAATAGILGLAVAPRETRLLASILTAFGLSDLLHGVYRSAVT